MFGLTQREQRWIAEQRAAETLVDLAKAAIGARAEVAVAEAKASALTEQRVREIVREELIRSGGYLENDNVAFD